MRAFFGVRLWQVTLATWKHVINTTNLPLKMRHQLFSLKVYLKVLVKFQIVIAFTLYVYFINASSCIRTIIEAIFLERIIVL